MNLTTPPAKSRRTVFFTATNGLANGEDAAFAVHHSEAAMREESGLIKRNFFSGDPDVI